jgi:hypothetical protein
MKPSSIATLATKAALDDLRILFTSLEHWNPDPPTVYIYCDETVSRAIPAFHYKGTIRQKVALNLYTDLNRAAMEKMPGDRKNLFFDFVCEKMNLLEWAFKSGATDVLFCDADICFLGPLFEIPETATLAVSPHAIRPEDEARYGKYNAGMIWFSNVELVGQWRRECENSQFYEQPPIEKLITKDTYSIPLTQNYGWWRMWQSVRSPQEIQAEWGFARALGGSGVTVAKQALGSVHTHFYEKKDAATVRFNEFVLTMLKRVATGHPPTRQFLRLLGLKA